VNSRTAVASSFLFASLLLLSAGYGVTPAYANSGTQVATTPLPSTLVSTSASVASLPSIVGSTTTNGALASRALRQTCFTNNQFLVFFSDGTNMVYSVSSNGADWSTPVAVRPASNGLDFSIWCDGTYVHYGGIDSSGDSVVYRRGSLGSNGVIKWSAPEQVAVTVAGHTLGAVSVAADSFGYPFVGYRDFTAGGVFVAKSSTNNGTWTTAKGFPFTLERKPTVARIAMVPLTNGKMAAVWAADTTPVYVRYWNGSNWSPCCPHAVGATVHAFFTAVAQGDNIQIAYLHGYKIEYSEYLFAYNAFTFPTKIQGDVGSDALPNISLNPTTGDLFIFWTGYPGTNHVYYKNYTASSGKWATQPTSWIDESSDGLTANYLSGSFYQAGGGFVGFVYQAGTTSPYSVKFDYLVVS